MPKGIYLRSKKTKRALRRRGRALFAKLHRDRPELALIAGQAAALWRRNHPEEAKRIYLKGQRALAKWRREHPKELRKNALKGAKVAGFKAANKWRSAHPEKVREIASKAGRISNARWRKEHPEQFHAHHVKMGRAGGEKSAALYKIPNGQCAICRIPCRLQRDHDHKTGIQRENLCSNCNRALGLIRDNPAITSAMTEYLLRHGARARYPRYSNVLPFRKEAVA